MGRGAWAMGPTKTMISYRKPIVFIRLQLGALSPEPWARALGPGLWALEPGAWGLGREPWAMGPGLWAYNDIDFL